MVSKAQARLLAGLTSVSDWIGSGEVFKDPEAPWETKINPALDRAGFISPTFRSGLSFQQVFDFEPRPVQQQFIDQVVVPGTYVLEAPMGLGKTEAAFYAAYSMLTSGQATGIYFALPTQLTSKPTAASTIFWERFWQRVGVFLVQSGRRPEPPRKESIDVIAPHFFMHSYVLQGAQQSKR